MANAFERLSYKNIQDILKQLKIVLSYNPAMLKSKILKSH